MNFIAYVVVMQIISIVKRKKICNISTIYTIFIYFIFIYSNSKKKLCATTKHSPSRSFLANILINHGNMEKREPTLIS